MLVALLAMGALSGAGCADPDAPPVGEEGVYLVMVRPPNVPEDYVATPNGYFDPSCVHEIDDDEAIDDNGDVTALDGTALRETPPCTFTHFDQQGNVVDDSVEVDVADDTPPANSWIEAAQSTAVGAVGYIHAQWNVPSAPSTKSNQTVYFFPGLQVGYQSGGFILQPVLGWNQAKSNIAGWSLMSWNCCVKGTNHTKPIKVTGSTVSGDVSGTGCNSHGVCSHWAVVSLDWSSNLSKTLHTTSLGKSLKWIVGGVLEAYNIDKCDKLPGGSVEFKAFYINKADGTHVTTPSWKTLKYPHTPSCGYSISYPGGHDATLHY